MNLSLKQKPLVVVILAFTCFFTLTFLKLHGFSITSWHYFIDSPNISDSSINTPDIIIGKPRILRSDDWVLDLAYQLAQTTGPASFAITNPNIGLGQNMAAPLKSMATGVISLLRPQLLGFFISNDIGLAWNWWFMFIGLFLSAFLAAWIISKNNFLLALGSAFFLLLSPYFQFWALHKSEIIIFGLLSFVFFVQWVQATKWQTSVFCGVALGWSGACMVFSQMYPAILVVMVYFLIILCICFSKEYLPFKKHNILRSFLKYPNGIGLLFAAATAGLLAFLFLQDAGDAIAQIQNTIYPGKRVSLGGDLPWWRFFSDMVFLPVQATYKGWGSLGNICEASSFFFYGFFLLPLMHRKRDALVVAMSIFALVLIIYSTLGLPAWLGQISLLAHSHPYRIMVGLGLINWVIMIRFFSEPNLDITIRQPLFYIYLILLLLFFLFLAWTIKSNFPLFSLPILIVFAIMQVGFILSLILYKKNAPYWFFILAFGFAPYTLSYNPLARGGANYLYDNILAKKIIEIQKNDLAEGKWIVVFTEPNQQIRAWALSNLPRILGVPSIGGYMCPPSEKLWQLLGVKDFNTHLVNQCAFITYNIADVNTEISFVPLNPGALVVNLSLTNPGLTALNVRHFLVLGELPLALNTTFKVDFTDSKLGIKILSKAVLDVNTPANR